MSVPPGSRAPYIIICSGRTAEMGAGSIAERIIAASNCAAQLCAFLETNHGSEVEPDDFREVSDLQHYLMDNMDKLKPQEATAKIKEMFKLLYELEHKFEEGHEY